MMQTDEKQDNTVTLLPTTKVNLHDSHAIRRELGAVYRDMRSGRLESSDGTKLAYVLNMLLRAYETCVLENELKEIKSTLKIGKNLEKENNK